MISGIRSLELILKFQVSNELVIYLLFYVDFYILKVF